MAALIHGTAKQYHGFDPRNIRGLEVWFDASDANTIVLTSGKVSQWNDKSGRNRHVSQANATLQPTYDTATRSLVCNGLSLLLNTNAATVAGIFTTAGTAFCVFNSTLSTNFRRILRAWESTVNGSILFDNSQVGVNYQGSGGYFTPGTNPTNTITLYHGTYNTTATFQYSVNGATATAIPTAFGGNAASTLLSVCNEYTGGSSGLTGNLYEILIFSTYLDDQQKQMIDGYLTWKWGIQAKMPTTQTYFNINPYARPLMPPDLFGGNTVLWLDGNDPSTVSFSSGTTVSYWRDKVSNLFAGVYTEPSGGVAYSGPTYDASTGALFFNNSNNPNKTVGQNGLRLMGQNGGVSSGRNLTLASGSFAIYVVYSTTRAATTLLNDVIQTRVNGASDSYVYQHHVDVGMGTGPSYVGPFISNGSSVTFSTTTAWSTANQYNILGTFFTLPTSTTATVNIRMNGTQFTPISGTVSSGATLAPDIQIFTLGAHVDNRNFSGFIREVIVIDNTTTADRNIEQLEGYLAWKWGLVDNLPSTHRFKTIQPVLVSPTPHLNPITRNFFVKYNQFGDPLFRCAQASAGTNTQLVYGISCDRGNNIVVSGTYRTSTLSLSNKNDVAFGTTLAARGSGIDCMYLVEYTPQGTLRWVTRAICSSSTTVALTGLTVITDTSDDIYVCATGGLSAASATYTFFNNGGTVSGGTRANTAVIDSPMFLAKYNINGSVLWLVRIVGSTAAGGTARNNTIYSLALDSTSANLFVGGWYISSAITVFDADNATNITLSGTAGSFSFYFLKYNSSGVLQARTRATTTGTTVGTSRRAICDTTNSVLYCGAYIGTMTIFTQPGITSARTLTPAGGQDGYIIKFDSSLNFTWAVTVGGSSSADAVFSVVTDSSNNVYACGQFQSTTCNFYNAADVVVLTATRNAGTTQDGFLAEYDSSGTPLWVVTTSAASGSTTFTTLRIDSQRNLYIHGQTTSTTLTFTSVSGLPKTYVMTKRSSGATTSNFVAIYDQNGQVINVRQITSIGGTDSMIQQANAFDLDRVGNVVAGNYSATNGNIYALSS